MRVWVRRLALIVALLVVVGYAGLCLWLRVNETRLAYSRSHPYVPPPSSLALHEQRVHLGDVDGTPLYAWVVHSLPEDASSNRWVVFFHGTGDNALEHAGDYAQLRALGFNILAPEYPGFVGMPGVPSETIIEAEAQTAYDFLTRTQRAAALDVVVYGISLGAAVAIDLASRVPVGALIEVAGFNSGVAFGQRLYPWLPMRLLLRNRWESDTKIGRVKAPVLVVHSPDDDVNPFDENAVRLYTLAAPPKRLLKIHGHHGPETTNAAVNPEFFSGLAEFLNVDAHIRVHAPPRRLAATLLATIEKSGVEAAAEQYRARHPGDYQFEEQELEDLGRYLLAARRPADALAVSRLNADAFPQSFRIYDDLGDAYAATGSDAEAAQSYRRALALAPEPLSYLDEKIRRLEHNSRSPVAKR